MKLIITSLILSLLLTACSLGVNTVEDLRNDPTGRFEFKTKENYQDVYRETLRMMLMCYGGPKATDANISWAVQEALYLDTKTANLTLYQENLGVGSIFMTIDISAINDEKTKVIVFYAPAFWGLKVQAVKKWVVADSEECKTYDRDFEPGGVLSSTL